MKDTKRIFEFLKANGWEKEGSEVDGCISFNKNGSIGIDVCEDEIVFIDDTGDFAEIPLNFYALVGFIFVNRLILPIVPNGI